MSADGKEGYASLRAARAIAKMPNGEAVLRVLQSFGFNQIVARDFNKGTLEECCTIDRMLEEMKYVNI